LNTHEGIIFEHVVLMRYSSICYATTCTNMSYERARSAA
jgi:hypothetical protein